MNRVAVDLIVPDKRQVHSTSNNASSKSDVPRYDGWVPSDYTGSQLKRDVAEFWQVDEAKYELLDGVAHVLVGDDTRLDSLTATTFSLRKRRAHHATPASTEPQGPSEDPFWLQEKLFDIFLIHTLPHWNGKGTPVMSCYQFKQLVLKATRPPHRQQPIHSKKYGHDLTVRVVLAFKTATPNSMGAGARFEEFLDALVDVANYLFGQGSSVDSKERVFERLAMDLLVPYYERLERETMHHYATAPSWSVLDDVVLTRPKVQSLLQRFTPSLFEIALAYSTSIAGPRYLRGLQFHEFSRLIHDVKATTVALNTLELCFCFIHCCRLEISNRFNSKALDETEVGPRSSLASMFTSTDGTGRGVLEVSCCHIAHVIAYLALLSIPPLAHAKPVVSDNTRISSKLAILSIKAFFHFLSLRLTSVRHSIITVEAAPTRFTGMKKDTTLPLVSVNFLQELSRMHREDALEDYMSSCRNILEWSSEAPTYEDDIQSQQQIEPVEKDVDPTPEQQETEVVNCDDKDDDLGLEIDWGDEVDRNVSGDDSDSPSGSTSDDEQEDQHSSRRELTPEQIALRRQREEDEMQSYLNDADEIYAFLANELHCHAIEGRLHDQQMVPPMLDIWVVAGQKYAQVISYLDSMAEAPEMSRRAQLDRKAKVLERFGASLFVFAMQLLKSTTKVFQYEELFQITNARVYNHATSELWDDRVMASFTTDLATETLSLASGKLNSVAAILEEMQALPQHEDPQESGEDSDDEQSSESAKPPASLGERYAQCLLLRANCLNVYGDVLAHNKRCVVDFELGCALEDDHDSLGNSESTSTAKDERVFFHSTAVLSKTSSPGQFYREAKRIYRFLLQESVQRELPRMGDHWVAMIHDRLATVQFKLATHLPRGCLVEKRLMTDMVHHLTTAQRLLSQCAGVGHRVDGVDQITAKRDYVSALRVLRSTFFQPETEKNSFDDHEADAIVPFYRFVLVAAIREVDPEKSGVLTQRQLSRFNEICGRSAVTEATMSWLVGNFDHLDDCTTLPALTEKGVFQYFCWLAEADPLTFCQVLDILTAKHTESPVSISSSITAQTGKEQRGKSLRTSLFNHTRQRASESLLTSVGTTAKSTRSTGIADCVVVVGSRMTAESCGDISGTASPCDVRLEPDVLDVLPYGSDVPEELSKFCFPDDPHMSNEALPPKTFDIVLTDITGTRLYGSCLQFYEEKDPIDLLAMISSVQRGNKTSSLPSWISLKDIQQRKAKTKCYLPKCVCMLSSVPLFQSFRESLTLLYRLSLSMPPFPIESVVFNLLEQVPVPTAVNALTAFSLVDHVRLLAALPPATPTLYPTEVDFTLLFQCLSPENILKVYGYLLTEKKIVLCSQNGSILTPIAETFRGLLYPFDCQVVYIPVLPLALLDFVTAPVPFFMGVRSEQPMDRLTNEGVIVVYLDRDEVAEPASESLPVLPEVRAKKLLQSLKKTSAWAASQRTRAQYGRYEPQELAEITTFPTVEASDNDVGQLLQQQEDLQEKWTELYLLFTTFVMRLLKDFRKYCRSSTSRDGHETTTFDSKAFLAMHPSQREFCTHLFHTQHFQRFIEHSATLSESVLQLAASDAEQSWRQVRAKTSMIRRGEYGTSDGDSLKSQPRQISRAPLPPRPATASATGSMTAPTHRRRASGRHVTTEVFAPFHSQVYDDLRDGAASRHSMNVPTTFPKASAISRPSLPAKSASTFITMSSKPRLETPTEVGE